MILLPVKKFGFTSQPYLVRLVLVAGIFFQAHRITATIFLNKYHTTKKIIKYLIHWTNNRFETDWLSYLTEPFNFIKLISIPGTAL